MSTRERWIVYPLLFMTLGIALRDKVVPPAHLGNFAMRFQAGEIATKRIQCNELQVGTVVCNRLESVQSQCRALLVNGPEGRPVVAAGSDMATHSGIVETFTAAGAPQVRLMSTPTGGMVNTISRAGQVALIMGDMGDSLGLFAQLPGQKSAVSLTLPVKLEVKPSLPQSPGKSAAPAQPPKKQSPPKPQKSEMKTSG